MTSIPVYPDIESMRRARQQMRGRVALVPTMGALHQGHATLIQRAAEVADHVIVSVFVNPTQFGPGEDFDAYPRGLDDDAAISAEAGAHGVFAPEPSQMYPSGALTRVVVDRMQDNLCGPHRPGHFDGVTTIVAKLFVVVWPDVALFGQKDYQQLAVLRRMAEDLLMPVEILGVPTVREPDGLAMSSRNRYLSQPDRAQARALSQALAGAWRAWHGGERSGAKLIRAAHSAMESFHVEPSQIDYIEVVDPETLHDRSAAGAIDEARGAVMALAVRVGKARLIDNLRLDGELPAELTAFGEESP